MYIIHNDVTLTAVVETRDDVHVLLDALLELVEHGLDLVDARGLDLTRVHQGRQILDLFVCVQSRAASCFNTNTTFVVNQKYYIVLMTNMSKYQCI